MTMLELAKTLARDQAFTLALNRVTEKVVFGKCICDEEQRWTFKCPVHEKET